jgi:putative membrane protein
MKTLTVLFAALSLVGCDDDDNDDNIQDLGVSHDLSANTGDLSMNADGFSARMTQPQSAQLVLTLNNGEVLVAQAVQARLTNAPILQFANDMISMHSAAAAEAMATFQKAGITPQPSQASLALENAATMMANQLSTMSSPDQAYIEGQVAMHTQALLLIDCVIRPGVSNASFITLLGSMRMDVVDHLQRATMLSGNVSTLPAGGAPNCATLCTGDLPEALRTAVCM